MANYTLYLVLYFEEVYVNYLCHSYGAPLSEARLMGFCLLVVVVVGGCCWGLWLAVGGWQLAIVLLKTPC